MRIFVGLRVALWAMILTLSQASAMTSRVGEKDGGDENERRAVPKKGEDGSASTASTSPPTGRLRDVPFVRFSKDYIRLFYTPRPFSAQAAQLAAINDDLEFRIEYAVGAAAPLMLLQVARQHGYPPSLGEKELEDYLMDWVQQGRKSGLIYCLNAIHESTNQIARFFAFKEAAVGDAFRREFKQKYPVAQMMDRMQTLKDNVALLSTPLRGLEAGMPQRFYRALWAAFKAVGEEGTFLKSAPQWDGTEASLPPISDWAAEGVRLQECFGALSFDAKYTFSEVYLKERDALEAAVQGASRHAQHPRNLR